LPAITAPEKSVLRNVAFHDFEAALVDFAAKLLAKIVDQGRIYFDG